MHKIGADIAKTGQVRLVCIYGKGTRDYIDAPLRCCPLVKADELVSDSGATLS
jgi:hypothetical protein